MTEVDLPDIVAEVSEVFGAYERALVQNDVETLSGYFWDDERTVRYGINECLYGAAQIAEWRARADPVPAGRTLVNTVITTFGSDAACVNTEFSSVGRSTIGRQSQTWIRSSEGWKIVSAHVSLLLPP